MNKTAIKNFAIWARNKLIADIAYKAGLLGINEEEIKKPLPQSTSTVQFFNIGTKEPYSITDVQIEQRKKLVEEIHKKAKQEDYKTAYKSVVEEVAYTWFNRLIAVRFMEVNDYLPTHVRVLSSECTGKLEPDLVTYPLEADLDYTPYEKDRIIQLKNENKLDELFRILFIKQCNELNAVLPELFEKTNDYTELLMNVSFTDQDGVVYHLVHDIDDDDFKEAVEIIGWMYQYYNDERKNQVINIYKGTIKKDDIPAATQLFTTDWVVRYMVDNSLGRYWIERNPESKLKEKLEFFVAPKDGDITYINEKVDPTELTFFDPCMGSGHILVYAFDVFIEIYREQGYSDRDAALSIVRNNLFGLDIDNRAYQLAYFAVMMKARSYNRRALSAGIFNNLGDIQESNGINEFYCDGITNDIEQNKVGEYLISTFKHAKEIGSLISVSEYDYISFYEYLLNLNDVGQIDIFISTWMNNTLPKIKRMAIQAAILSKKYTIVCTNPPYMNKLESHLKDFVTKQYKPYSGDLFSVFMYRNFDFCKHDGYSAFMTPFVWMFIKTYENLREYIINNKSIITLVQMEYSAFEEATVPICTFVLRNEKAEQSGCYIKLSDFKGGMEVQKSKVLDALISESCEYFYETKCEKFSKIPGIPIAYWVSESFKTIYNKNKTIADQCEIKQGLATCNNSLFVRDWTEIDFTKMKKDCKNRQEAILSKAKWFPYNKGGGFRKWYGNNYTVVDWEDDGNNIHSYNKIPKTFQGAPVRAKNYYFREGITYGLISSMAFSARSVEDGFVFDVGGSMVFTDKEYKKYIIGLLCSKITSYSLNVFNPTLNYQVGDIGKVGLIISDKYKSKVDELVSENISISKTDWDSFETSWDFEKHPFIIFKSKSCILSDIYESWQCFREKQFLKLKNNEVELNKIFIEIYGLNKELSSNVEDKDVTIQKADLQREIRSFILYAIGCMFGRYSLDIEGLAYAGGEWNNIKYSTFIPDKDNIIPINDEEYFEDDIVGQFCAFLKKTFGEETLEENLDFIAKALGNNGNSSREVIRNYFLKDFFKDHCKIYQKLPIYWQFDSGKADGFKALVYMHRYNEDTIGNLRIDYLHKMQRVYENEIKRMQEIIENSNNAREVTATTKRKEKLVKQLKETKEYDEKIAHLALARISIDLDDGVKVNYEKVQTGTDGKKLQVLAKI